MRSQFAFISQTTSPGASVDMKLKLDTSGSRHYDAARSYFRLNFALSPMEDSRRKHTSASKKYRGRHVRESIIRQYLRLALFRGKPAEPIPSFRQPTEI